MRAAWRVGCTRRRQRGVLSRRGAVKRQARAHGGGRPGGGKRRFIDAVRGRELSAQVAGVRFWCCARRAASRAAPERSFRPPPWWRLLRACRRGAARRRLLQRGQTRVTVWGLAAPPLPHRRPPFRAWRVVRLASCLASYRQGAGEVFRPAGGPGKSTSGPTQIWTNSGILFQQSGDDDLSARVKP